MSATLSVAAASNILKVYYTPGMQEIFNTQTIFWDRLEKISDTWRAEGKDVTVAIHYGRHSQAASGRPFSSADLPQTAIRKDANAIVKTTALYTNIAIEGAVIASARSNAGSFVRAIKGTMDDATEAHAKSLNRQANGDGSGWLAKVVSGSTTSYVVDDGNGHHNVYLQPGNPTQVDWIDTDNTTVHLADATVTLGAEVATGFSLTTESATLADGDYAVPEGELGYAMTGRRAIISAADPAFSFTQSGLQGLPVATYPWWAAQIVGDVSSPQDLSFTRLNKVVTKIEKNTPNGREDIKFILCSPNSSDKYFQLASDMRQSVNVMVLDGGYTGLEFSGMPIVTDPDAEDGYFDFIVPDALAICQFADDDWMDMDGNVLHRIAGKDAYGATMFAYRNIGVKARNALGSLVGVVVD